MRRILFLILIILIFGIGGCTQFERTNPADPGGDNFQTATIEGTVISTTGISLEGAEISISNGEDRSTTTSAEGKYSIPDILGGKTYTVTASKDGYSQESKKLIPEAGKVSTVDIVLKDIEDPIIAHARVPEAGFGIEVEIEVAVIDNEKVSKPKVFYKKSTDNYFTESLLEETSKDTYTGVIPSDFVVLEGVDYYIFVEDTIGNSVTSGSNDNPYHITVTKGTILILDKELVSIPEGNTATVTATARKADGMTDNVTAISSNESVATASVSGNTIAIKGVARGNTTVLVTSGSGFSETAAVSVTQPGESSLILDKTAVSVVIDDTVIVNVIATKVDGSPDTINAFLLNSDVALASVISKIIKIDGVSLGSTIVVVTSGEGRTATIEVNVTSAEDQRSLILGKTSLIIPVGGKEIIDITAAKSDGSEDTVSVTSNNTSVTTVLLSGFTLTVNGVGKGDTTVIVESGSGLTESVSVTVFQPGTAALSLDKTGLAVEVGKTTLVNIKALKSDGTADTVTATIDPSGITTVTASADSKNITINGVAVGNATVTVTSVSGGLSKTLLVTAFKGKVLSLDKTSLTVGTGKSELINVTALKADGTVDSFNATIAPGGIATVTSNLASKNISVVGVGVGSATITVASSSALTATASVTVIPGLDITPPTSTSSPISELIIGASTQIVITFSESMDTGTLVLGGTMASESGGSAWSTTTTTDDTLTLSPSTEWNEGSGRTLTIDAKDRAGNPLLTLSLTYNVLSTVVYVSTSGDDKNPGTADLPKLSIKAAIELAASLDTTVEVHVAAGTYDVSYQSGNHVMIMEGISIFGGYSPLDWNDRNPNSYQTIIKDQSELGGTSSEPNRAIEARSNVTNKTIIDGFSVFGGGGDYSSAIFTLGSSITIQNNIIKGGMGEKGSIGIGNILSKPNIRDNEIDGGSGEEVSYGILNAASSPNIQSNIINGGTSKSLSIGISNLFSSQPKIQNNTIDGGSKGNDSMGISNVSSSPSIQNNVISGGTSKISFGIFDTSSSSTILQNNTINGGSGSDSSNGISIKSSSPRIENNIIFTQDSYLRICIGELDSDSDPKSLMNNNLFDCPLALYSDNDGSGILTDVANVNDFNNTTQDNINKPSTGNVSIDPDFADIDGLDDDINTMEDNDWHLTASSSTSITQGGLNLSSSFTSDKDGITRTVPWSLGAYEKD